VNKPQAGFLRTDSRARELAEQLGDSAGRGEIVTGSEQMAGVQADVRPGMPVQRVQVGQQVGHG
jgi:hypothetical protein